jgi:hypothetical protein
MISVPLPTWGGDGGSKPIFTREEVAAYKPIGASRCFRQICLEYNTPTRAKQRYAEEELRSFFSKYDPVAYAKFCKDIHLDAALMLAVPQGGYTTYLQTKVGEPYPYLKGCDRDFFGETTRELHKQGIACLGYIIIGWNIKYGNEHPEVSFGNPLGPLICLNSPYTDLVIEYSREVLTHYPIDGLRYDILDQPAQCRCADCRKFHKELFADEMPEEWPDWRRRERFRMESITRCMRRIYEACKAVKPSVEIWQNWFNDDNACDLRASKYVDLAYLEFADPFRELFLNGVFNKGAVITGKILEDHRARRTCMALGGRCYSYFEVNGATALPNETDWFHKDLAPFYAMVEEIEPYLVDAKPVPYAGVVFSEATRFRYDGYSRQPHMALLRRLTEPYLARSLPLEFIASEHLARRDLSQFKLLVLLESSGLDGDARRALCAYARRGGQLLIAGPALLFDEAGAMRDDFSLAGEMGVSYAGGPQDAESVSPQWKWSNLKIGGERAAFAVSEPGTRTLNVWMREPGTRVDRILLTRKADLVPSEVGPAAGALRNGFWAESDGTVVFEAEDFKERVNRGPALWEERRDRPGFAGRGFLQALPFDAAAVRENYEDASAELRYSVRFESSGTWFLWTREWCDGTAQDSVHAGLDGKGMMSFDFKLDTAGLLAGKSVGGGLPPIHLDRETTLPLQRIQGPVTMVRAVDGAAVLTGVEGERHVPLLHARRLGKGKIVYLAASRDMELARATIDALVGSVPVAVSPPEKQAILTRQDKKGRWILHLMDDGACTVDISREFAAPSRVVEQHPPDGWRHEVVRTSNGLRVRVSGNARDRLLALE